MKSIITIIVLLLISPAYSQEIVTSDINNFWNAYDKIRITKDSVQQYSFLKEIFLDKGTPGLQGIMLARNYTPKTYIDAINNYPEFWKSVRPNTLKNKTIQKEISANLKKLKVLYPEMKTAPIYFTIGVLRTGGTVYDGKVLIGSEQAFADINTVTTEFPEPMASARKSYFATNPINTVTLLTIHEYIHSQQKPIVNNLLSQCLYEGVAEFLSVKVTGLPSTVQAINFGRQNEEWVKKVFEREVFNFRMSEKWLWSDAQNEFNTRDLGYYIGYAICEDFYNKASDKKQVVKQMIELDYSNESAIEDFVNNAGFFSGTINDIYNRYEALRPYVVSLKNIENGNKMISPSQSLDITVTFSQPLDTNYRNFNFGPLGEDTLMRIKSFKGFSDDNKSITFEVSLLPETHYQMEIGDGFRTVSGIPIKPYLIDFHTAEK